MNAGLLVVWNRIAPEDDADFNAWYDSEHLAERLALPGFLAARRYRGLDDTQRYGAIYDTESTTALASPAYLARLADPTPATRAIMGKFRDMHRAICEVDLDACARASTGACAVLVEIGDATLSADRADQIARASALRIRLARPDAALTQVPTPEQRMRGAPDTLPSRLLLIEGDDDAACVGAAAQLAPGRPAMRFALLYERRKPAACRAAT